MPSVSLTRLVTCLPRTPVAHAGFLTSAPCGWGSDTEAIKPAGSSGERLTQPALKGEGKVILSLTLRFDTEQDDLLCVWLTSFLILPSDSSPSRLLRPSARQAEAQYSSHSSSNTLSSNASSSHSEERWFDGGMGGSGGLGDPAEPDLDPLAKGGSSDSGIDASTLYTPSPGTKPAKPPRSHLSSQKPLHGSATYSGLQELAGRSGDGRRRESSPALPASSTQSKSYRTRTFPPPGASADSFKPRCGFWTCVFYSSMSASAMPDACQNQVDTDASLAGGP